MNAPTAGWTSLQHHEGRYFLRWLQVTQRLRTSYGLLSRALNAMLEESVQTRKDALIVWTAVPAVLSRCNDPGTYRMHGAAAAYAWLHLPDRYVRTWLALQQLLQESLLPMGSKGVRVLDIGTGPGPSALAAHDFYAAMVEFAEKNNSSRWRQPADVTCVECSAKMNHFRHHLAENLTMQGAPKSVLRICNQIEDFKSIRPRRERRELHENLRRSYDDYFDEHTGRWESERRYTSEEANYIANIQHRYRLFTFSNFLTTSSTLNAVRPNLTEVFSDAHPGSVLLIIGGTSDNYQEIYAEVAAIAEGAGFSRKAEGLSASCSDVGMDDLVYAEGVSFFQRLKHIAGDLPDDDHHQRTVAAHFEGSKRVAAPKSAVRAYRK